MKRLLSNTFLSAAMILTASVACAQRAGNLGMLGGDVTLKKTVNFKLPVDYDYSKMRTVKTKSTQAAGTVYTIGRISHGKYVAEGVDKGIPFDYGKSSLMTFYATNDDRIIAVPQKGMPRELALFVAGRTTYAASNVVREARAARKDTTTAIGFKIKNAMELGHLFTPKKGHFELEIDVTPDTARISGFDIVGEGGDTCRIYLDNKAGKLTLADKGGDISSAPLRLCEGGKYHLDIFVDHSHVDIFVDEGRIALSGDADVKKPADSLRLFSAGGKSKFSGIYVYGL